MTEQVKHIDIQKELVRSAAAGFQMQDQHEAVNMGNMAKPKLLTVLMGGADVTSKVYGQTHVFQYDETKYTPATVSGKRYDERGNDISKDESKTRYYEIGSKGIRLNVSPMDYDGKRKPGTNELLTESDVLADQIMKASDAFDIETELEYAQLLTVGTNRTAGGPAAVYDFHTDILGVARPAAVSIDYASTTVDPDNAVKAIKNKLEDKVSQYGLSSNGVVVICGDNAFDKAMEFEKRINIARDLRSTVDIVSQMIPTIDAEGYRYDNFDSPTTGVRYIRYGAGYFGTKLIDTNSMFMIPVITGATLVKEAYAPAKVQGIVNTQALNMYSWFFTDTFVGITGFYEQNKLSMLPRPDLIVAMTAA